jgi:hypothetical protein
MGGAAIGESLYDVASSLRVVAGFLGKAISLFGGGFPDR